MKNLLLTGLSILTIFFCFNVNAQDVRDFSTSGTDETPSEVLYHRFINVSQTDAKSLDIVNDGTNKTVQLAKSAKVSGQQWKMTDLKNGYFSLSTAWLGDNVCLDVINDGTNNQVQMAKSGDFSGQQWKVTKLSNGYYRLTCAWLGSGFSLEMERVGITMALRIFKTADVDTQYWKILDF